MLTLFRRFVFKTNNNASKKLATLPKKDILYLKQIGILELKNTAAKRDESI